MGDKKKDFQGITKISIYVLEGLMIMYVLYILYTSANWVISF
jgi:hypothetical protein